MVRRISAALFAFGLLGVASASANPAAWQREWPRTDFSKTAVDYSEILSGGPPKDGIPSIDEPEFKAIAEVDHLGDMEPVIGVVINGDARAYPLQVLIWHEIVNDTVGGVPVSVTFCPLCNTGLVFDRRLGAGFSTSAPRASCATPTSSCTTARPRAGGSSFSARPLSASSRARV